MMNLPKVTSDIVLLRKICKKILENPDKQRYRDLNVNTLQNKFVEYLNAVDLLFMVGFIKSEDGSRLIMKQIDSNKVQKIKNMYHHLQSISTLNGDEQNIRNLDELISRLKVDMINSTEDNGEYLKVSNVYHTLSYDLFECNLKECLCLKIICNVLTKYHQYIINREGGMEGDDNIFDIIYSQIGNKYNNIDLLDDFNHLLIHHSNEFENIYNVLNEKVFDNMGCDLANCLCRRRNHRNRSEMRENQNGINKLYFGNDNVVEQQLLDRIHCYFFHSFDTGYKLTESEKQHIIYDETEEKKNDDDEVILTNSQLLRINHIITSKSKQNDSTVKFDRIYSGNQNKFITTDFGHEYSFGYRYFYWEPYRNNTNTVDIDLVSLNISGQEPNEGYTLRDWFIDKKYCNLKTELLNNDICVISQLQWINLLKKANMHIQTDKVKEIYCPRRLRAMRFEMIYGQLMSVDHLIAMMTYCNYDELQYKFSETYRKLNVYETIDSIKRRHRNFYFLGKSLRECVECFGMDIFKDNGARIRVYHGVTEQFVFPSMSPLIKGPFSTSTDYSVAVHFSGNTGMILQLEIDAGAWIFAFDDGADASERVGCLEMSWISDYVNEQEVFSIGGLYPFTFEAIIQAPKGIDYIKYITAIQHMTFGMNEGNLTYFHGIYNMFNRQKPTSETLQVAYRLFCHQIWKHDPNNKQAIQFKSCPKYVDYILDLHCNKIKRILVYDKVNKVNDHFFRYDNGWIKLDLYSIIFQNIETLTYTARNKDISFLKDPFIYECVLQFLCKYPQTKLKAINIMFDVIYLNEIENVINNYKNRFKVYGWSIYTFSKKLNTLRNANIDRIIQNEEYLLAWNMLTEEREAIQNMMHELGLTMFDPNNPTAFGSASIEIQIANYSSKAFGFQ